MSARAGEVGLLSIVATPIGNLDDITLRAVATMRAADVVLAEDTRRTRTLLNHHGIATPLRSFHAHSVGHPTSSRAALPRPNGCCATTA